MKKRSLVFDPVLFWLSIAATLVGMFFIFDAGYARSLATSKGTMPPEFRSQLMFVVPAIVASFVVSRVRAGTWRRVGGYLWAFTLLLVVAVDKVGIIQNGARRWIGAGQFVIQPAEFAKLAVIVYLASVFTSREEWTAKWNSTKRWYLNMDDVVVPKLVRCLPALWVLVAVFFIEKEPDLGTAAVIAVTAFAMFVAGGASKKTLAVGVLLATFGIGYMIKKEPYRLERIENHWTRWDSKNVDDSTFQTDLAEFHISDGGVLGVGIGNGRAKHVLPATTTDFISVTIGEETGLIGSLAVLALIGGIVWRLLWLARRATQPFSMLVLFGVAFWLGVQACTNLMMANAALPAIGIPLPFISSGGSSLVALWLAVGVCQSALAPQPVEEESRASNRNRWWNRRTRLSGA